MGDIYSLNTITVGTQKASFTGNVISAKPVHYKSGAKEIILMKGNHFSTNYGQSKPKALNYKASDITIPNFNGYELLSGKINLIQDGTSTPLSKESLNGSWEYDPARGWTVSGGEVVLDKGLKVEGDLFIQSEKLTINGPFSVNGSVTALTSLTINGDSAFEDTAVILGGFDGNDLKLFGRIYVGENFTTTGTAEIIGSMVVDGNISFRGKTKLTYLDTVYKAALLSAQEKLGETLLTHSQVFKDLKGRNTTALLTFVKGYKQYNENQILEMIENNEINPIDYYSVVMGASADYGAELIKYDGLASYYGNKIKIGDKLREKGYKNLEVVEALNPGGDSLYLTFRDKETGVLLGTYLVGGGNIGKEQNANGLMALTTLDRQKILASIDTQTTRNQKAEVAEGATSFGEELRVQEWRYVKGLEEIKKEVEMEILVEDTAVQNFGQKNKHKRFFKRLVRIVVVIIAVAFVVVAPEIAAVAIIPLQIDACRTSTSVNFIEWVNEGQNDDWTNKIAMLSDRGPTAPAAATAVMRYHGLKKGVSLFYDDNDLLSKNIFNQEQLRSRRISPYKYAYELGQFPLYRDIYETIGKPFENYQSLVSGVPSPGGFGGMVHAGIKSVLDRYKVPNAVSFIAEGTLFNNLVSEIQNNRPALLHTFYYSAIINSGSYPVVWGTRPVLGTKHITVNKIKDCAFGKRNQQWVYVHDMDGIENKLWYRLESDVYNGRHRWTGEKINLN